MDMEGRQVSVLQLAVLTAGGAVGGAFALHGGWGGHEDRSWACVIDSKGT